MTPPEAATGKSAVVFSLGSNLGDRLANLQLGLDVLRSDGLDLQAVSSVYETDPVGGVDQSDYLNAVLIAASSLAARDILPGARPLKPRRAASGQSGGVRGHWTWTLWPTASRSALIRR